MKAVIATDSVAARGLVNGWCLPRSGRRERLSVAIPAYPIYLGNFADNRIIFHPKYSFFCHKYANLTYICRLNTTIFLPLWQREIISRLYKAALMFNF